MSRLPCSVADWTPRLQNLYDKAVALGLDDPFGRAVYALNRAYNCGTAAVRSH